MVCVDCKGTCHRDHYSGYCSWNTTNFTLPVEKRTPENPKIREPTQETAGGTQPQKSNRYVDSCAATVDKVIDRIRQTKNSGDRGQETGQAAIQDASSWTEEEKRDFVQYKKDREDFKADRVRQINFKTVTGNNQQDSFQVIGISKATFYREREEADETEIATAQSMCQAMKVYPTKEEIINNMTEITRLQGERDAVDRAAREKVREEKRRPKEPRRMVYRKSRLSPQWK